MRLLDRLFATPTRLAEDDRDFFGDFTLHAEAPLAEVAESYGFALPEPGETRTVGDLPRRTASAAGSRSATGCRSAGSSLIRPRRRRREDEVTEVGLALEPSRGAQPKLPVFQNLSEIAAWIRG